MDEEEEEAKGTAAGGEDVVTQPRMRFLTEGAKALAVYAGAPVNVGDAAAASKATGAAANAGGDAMDDAGAPRRNRQKEREILFDDAQMDAASAIDAIKVFGGRWVSGGDGGGVRGVWKALGFWR